jgi:hypothetical protein
MFVWSALALLFATRQPRIPRAIVRRLRSVRFRDAVETPGQRLGSVLM